MTPRRWLRSLGVQLAAVTLFSIVLAAGIVAGLAVAAHRADRDRNDLRVGLGAFFTIVRMLAEADDTDRRSMLASARRSYPKLDFVLDTASTAAPLVHRRGPPSMLGTIAEELGGRWPVRLVATGIAGGPPERAFRVAVRIAPEVDVVAWVPDVRPPEAVLQFGGLALVLGLTLLVVLPWVAWRVARPLTRFASAAAEFTPDAAHDPLPEEGPEEVRRAARAFNAMRRRIADLVADRTRMLASAGHDLRTPITRMRLRVEFVEPAPVRAALVGDLDHMHRLVEAVLADLRGARAPAALASVDLSALVQTVADEASELGGDVVAVLPRGRVAVDGRIGALKRALDNLVENALRYGKRAELRLAVVRSEAWIEVVDDGPGIPEAQQAEMLRPFVRGAGAERAAPGVPTDGLGLGLSIAAGVAAEHGGALAFDRVDGGRFAVRLTLPLGSGAAAP